MQGGEGKVAVVMGASRGIGEMTARQFAHDGWAVVLAARNLDACRRISHDLRQAGGSAEPVRCDVSNYEQVERVIEHTLRRFGRVDALVVNAAVIEPIGNVEDCTPDEFVHAVSVNLIGTFYCLHAVLAVLRGGNGGVIVNVSTGAINNYIEGWGAYCASKIGAAMLAAAVAKETAESNVRVYSLQPGIVDTEMQATIRASGVNPSSRRPRSQLASPREPAQVIVWLCTAAPVDLVGRELDIAEPDLRRRAGLLS